MKDLKWKHNNCCNENVPCYHEGCQCRKEQQTLIEVLTPYPKKRNGFERFLNRYNHMMEFARTILALITVTLQLIILYKLIT